MRRARMPWSATCWTEMVRCVCPDDTGIVNRRQRPLRRVLNAPPFHCAVGVATLCARRPAHYDLI